MLQLSKRYPPSVCDSSLDCLEISSLATPTVTFRASPADPPQRYKLHVVRHVQQQRCSTSKANWLNMELRWCAELLTILFHRSSALSTSVPENVINNLPGGLVVSEKKSYLRELAALCCNTRREV